MPELHKNFGSRADVNLHINWPGISCGNESLERGREFNNPVARRKVLLTQAMIIRHVNIADDPFAVGRGPGDFLHKIGMIQIQANAQVVGMKRPHKLGDFPASGHTASLSDVLTPCRGRLHGKHKIPRSSVLMEAFDTLLPRTESVVVRI